MELIVKHFDEYYSSQDWKDDFAWMKKGFCQII